MKSFLTNPTEFFLNLFGYSMKKKPSLLFMSMMDTTNGNWVERMTFNGHIDRHVYRLYSTLE
jgi:hypothetical protein